MYFSALTPWIGCAKVKKIIINNEININKLNFTHMRLYVFQSDIKTYKFVLREFPG